MVHRLARTGILDKEERTVDIDGKIYNLIPNIHTKFRFFENNPEFKSPNISNLSKNTPMRDVLSGQFMLSIIAEEEFDNLWFDEKLKNHKSSDKIDVFLLPTRGGELRNDEVQLDPHKFGIIYDFKFPTKDELIEKYAEEI